MTWLRRLLCRLFGHRRAVEDLGDVEYQTPWQDAEPAP
jgi:hypothetical protein